MQEAFNTYRQASLVERIVIRVRVYRVKFPLSEISTRCLAAHFSFRNGRVAVTGALYLEEYGIPIPEFDAEPETINQQLAAQVNVQQLSEANLSYDIVSEDRPFVLTDIEWWDAEKGQVVTSLPGELRGTKELPCLQPVLHEPLTYEEAWEFIACSLSPEWLAKDANPKTTAEKLAFATLNLKVTEIVSKFDDLITIRYHLNTRKVRINKMLRIMWERQEDDANKALYTHFETEWDRIRAAVKRENVGGEWSYTGNWFIGEREGLIHDQAVQNDLLYTKQEQHHQPGELVGGKYIDSEELEKARLEDVFDQMYGGFTRNSEGKVVEVKRAADGCPGNRGNTGHRLYLRRCAERRIALCQKKLWHMLTWPKEWLPTMMEGIRTAYRKTTKENAPGPGRRQVNGQWINVPLEGQRALNWLRARGAGSLAGQKVHPELKIHKGETWHNSILKREHLEILEEAFQWRMARDFEGLPKEYVKEHHLGITSI